MSEIIFIIYCAVLLVCLIIVGHLFTYLLRVLMALILPNVEMPELKLEEIFRGLN